MNQKAIPASVIKKDRALTQNKKQSQFDLDKHRWEQCEDPNGPRYPRAAYAKAVGIVKSTLSDSISSWATALAAANPQVVRPPNNSSTDTKASGRPKAAVVQDINSAIEAGEEMAEPTTEVHDTARRDATNSTRRSTMIGALAEAFGLSVTTVQDTKPDWPGRRNALLVRATEKEQEGMSWDDACFAAAEEIHQEVEIEKEQTRVRKEQEAAQAAQATPTTFVINAVVAATKVFEKELKKISLDSVLWEADSVAALEQELNRLQGVLDRVRLLPTEEQISTASLEQQ